ncbi:MAG: hypothetical protein AVDCRST_MAG02-1039, partial [uncultured Rubrobacteraceae bacterium]
VHKRPGGVRAPRPDPQLLRAGGGGRDLVRGPTLRLPGVHHHLPRRPGLLRPGQPRPRARQSGIPGRLRAPGRQGGGDRERRGAGDPRRALRLAAVLRRPEPVHGAPDGPTGVGAVGQDPVGSAPRASAAAGLRHPLPALGPRGQGGHSPRRFRAFPGPDRPPQTPALVARARPPLRPGSAKGHGPGRDEGRQRVRPPYPGSV